jgi:hypothetical protein
MGMGAIGGVLSSGMSAFGSIMGGKEKARAIRQQARQEAMGRMYQAGQLEIAAAVGDLKATQTDTAMRRRTEDGLATVDAVLALTGKTDQSPTGWAVKNRFEGLADEARTQATWNLRFDAQSKRNAAVLYKLGAQMAIDAGNASASDAETSGFMGGIGGLLKGFSGINFSF